MPSYSINYSKGIVYKWWQIPGYLRRHPDFETDHYKAYSGVTPGNQHFQGKSLMQSIGAFKGRLRSRISRLVRTIRSFSKGLTMHKLAVRYFLYHANLKYQTALHLWHYQLLSEILGSNDSGGLLRLTET